MNAAVATPVVSGASAASHSPSCRFCGEQLVHTFVDLGTSPLCNRTVTPATFNRTEAVYPLHAYVCDKCWLVQLPSYVAASEIFDDQYTYFSSFSASWLRHAKDYVEMITPRLGLGPNSRVVEIASNDGYLLQNFVAKGIPCLGVEPTANTAAEARKKGVESVQKFFGRVTALELREEFGPVDLILGNNVLAHVPDINDFVSGLKALLADRGVVTMEFPLLLHLIDRNYFDTIYHEHFSYLSFSTVETIFARHGLVLFDVDELSTHGGSIRIYARHDGDASKPVHARVAELKQREETAGHRDLNYYTSFGERVKETKRRLLEFLIEAKRAGKSVAGYGAPGKGNTLLNYCGVRTDFLDYTVDRNPHKCGHFLPGTRIPIHHVDKVRETRPDYLLILPWNLREEIMREMSYVREWGCRFVVPIPTVQVFE